MFEGHEWVQGAVLQSSDRGGIRIQYSKNPYGKKRDHTGTPVEPTSLTTPAPGQANGESSPPPCQMVGC